MGIELGPSLLPPSEQLRSRADRRQSISNSSRPAPIAHDRFLSVSEVHINGVRPGVNQVRLRHEVGKILQTMLTSEGTLTTKNTRTTSLRHDAGAEEIALSIARAIAHRMEEKQ